MKITNKDIMANKRPGDDEDGCGRRQKPFGGDDRDALLEQQYKEVMAEIARYNRMLKAADDERIEREHRMLRRGIPFPMWADTVRLGSGDNAPETQVTGQSQNTEPNPEGQTGSGAAGGDVMQLDEQPQQHQGQAQQQGMAPANQAAPQNPGASLLPGTGKKWAEDEVDPLYKPYVPPPAPQKTEEGQATRGGAAGRGRGGAGVSARGGRGGGQRPNPPPPAQGIPPHPPNRSLGLMSCPNHWLHGTCKAGKKCPMNHDVLFPALGNSAALANGLRDGTLPRATTIILSKRWAREWSLLVLVEVALKPPGSKEKEAAEAKRKMQRDRENAAEDRLVIGNNQQNPAATQSGLSKEQQLSQVYKLLQDLTISEDVADEAERRRLTSLSSEGYGPPTEVFNRMHQRMAAVMNNETAEMERERLGIDEAERKKRAREGKKKATDGPGNGPPKPGPGGNGAGGAGGSGAAGNSSGAPGGLAAG